MLELLFDANKNMSGSVLARLLILGGALAGLGLVFGCGGSGGSGNSPAPTALPSSSATSTATTATPSATPTPLGQACARFPTGSTVQEPEALFSVNGVLKVNLFYQTAVAPDGNTLYCWVLPDGNQSPTLHVHPGDHLVIDVTNDTPAPTSASDLGIQMSSPDGSVCGAATMNSSSVNLHFHGTNVSPTCHSDDVINTLINSGQTFHYDVAFPTDEPPGLYWYHPHVHTLSEGAVLGGATGAIVVDGIENVQPAVAGLPYHVLIVRDNLVPGTPPPGNIPSTDLSLNYIPIPYPNYPPAILSMNPGESQFWRVLNASADTELDLQLLYDGVPQPLQIVALDGVPTGSQDGTSQGKIVVQTDMLLTPGARVEFIMTGPSASVHTAELVTQAVDNGPYGDNDTARPLLSIQTSDSPETASTIPAVSGPPNPQRFAGLAEVPPSVTRRLYFSEINPTGNTSFYITVDGQTPEVFSPDNPPAIVTTQGSVEDWIIENRAEESHSFHIHQIHYLLLERDGVPVSPDDRQLYDTVLIPYWSGTGPYPSIKVRMDFRGPIVGDFVYHCHLLYHEDHGMMAIIRVLPQGTDVTAYVNSLEARRARFPLCPFGSTTAQVQADEGWFESISENFFRWLNLGWSRAA